MKDDPQFDALISFLGSEALEHVDHNIKPIPLKSGDSIILCSDGLYRGLEREEWLGVLAEQDPSSPTATQKKAEALLDLVLTKQRNNQDNATIALIDVAVPRQ